VLLVRLELRPQRRRSSFGAGVGSPAPAGNVIVINAAAPPPPSKFDIGA